jgi:hypothetical protein
VDGGLTHSLDCGRKQEGGLRVAINYITVESIPAFGVLLQPVHIIRWQIEWTMANIIAIAGSWVGWRKGIWVGRCVWMGDVDGGKGERRKLERLVYTRPKLNQAMPWSSE